jgi:lipid A 3-O-deacylase
MARYFFTVLISIYGIPKNVFSQAMDNTIAFRNIESNKYFRINYENDYFTATDFDYTQGILIEKVHPAIGHFFLTKILWHPTNSDYKYGLALEHNAYTPKEIDRYEIQYGARPYAGVLMLKTFLIATNDERKRRISVSFDAGVIGAAAGGEWMQKTIHHLTNYIQPEGWHNQIQNDIALNYQVNVEKEFYRYNNLFSVSGYGSARVGTLSDKISGGVTVMLGDFINSFVTTPRLKKQFQWHLYDQLIVNGVAYDATMQGGVFNHNSVYTIPNDQINRLALQHKFGLVVIFHRLYLEYFQTGITQEFRTSVYHRTGGVQIGFGF